MRGFHIPEFSRKGVVYFFVLTSLCMAMPCYGRGNVMENPDEMNKLIESPIYALIGGDDEVESMSR